MILVVSLNSYYEIATAKTEQNKLAGYGSAPMKKGASRKRKTKDLKCMRHAY